MENGKFIMNFSEQFQLVTVIMNKHLRIKTMESSNNRNGRRQPTNGKAAK
jgi:hypothetical protein